MISKTMMAAALASALAGMAGAAYGQVPAGYPADYQKIIDAAKKEGKVVIYGATDSKAAAPLIKDFNALYPGITVEYNDMNSTEVYNRFISEVAAGGNTADVMWSSAMDLQMRLASDGYALKYKSVEAARIPGWAMWDDMAYGTTFEPAAIVYNKRLVDPKEVPATHADFAKLITQPKFKDKVTTYDIEKSGVGFMFMTQDAKEFPKFPDLQNAFGVAKVRVQSSTGTMMERISSGENLIGYNVLGSYALVRAKTDPSIGVVLPKDYTLILSRVQFINKNAKNVNAGKLWLDYVLSQRGQTVIANDSKLFAIRADVKGETTSSDLIRQIGAENIKPVPVHPIVLQFLGPAKRMAFLKQWKETAGKK
ncbi:ABC transporter substrate-binding protein [Janthinobacterium agaricidamnosum]|uniref:Bacterial extracellular solute-binding family protein n=1 Tax=Janthinobacterium agaricidamnosum NBRC 102515 = DSM 9628 TaxID=1349767 RepID=W0V8F0_9BURK|nr:ABC transporter substrate-binding protein [Janthinobacterium agaricidamnosum]CDG84166.1 bacterial extracellular solute-binding family protein [Janthinobacterium agaricidamnosum NBRC 102515 = DSM 9628]